MQNWKLIKDSALTDGPDRSQGEGFIPDLGFASTGHPKLKFNFTMDISFRGVTKGSDTMEVMDIPLKSATRPNQSISLMDVNYYNYRTKIATKMEIGTGTIVMYDDGDNKAHKIYEEYMSRISPIFNTKNSNDLIANPSATPFGKMSSIGSVGQNPNGILDTISVYHFYYGTRGSWNRKQYKYINPKIQTFELDELSMSESDVNSISMTFSYDSVTILDQVMS